MSTEQEPLTNQQASEALNSINSSKITIVESQRPPYLLAMIIGLSYGSIVFGYGMTEHENNWALAMWAGAIAFGLSTSFYYYTFRLLGIKLNILPRTANSVKFNIIIGIVLAICVISSREVRLLGLDFAPHLFAIISGLVMFITLRIYPNGEVIPKTTDGAEKESSDESN